MFYSLVSDCSKSVNVVKGHELSYKAFLRTFRHVVLNIFFSFLTGNQEMSIFTQDSKSKVSLSNLTERLGKKRNLKIPS